MQRTSEGPPSQPPAPYACETTHVPFEMRRLGIVMAPDPHDALEAMGVLNPAAARGLDGHLYLFPRVVAAGNYSRIGRVRVRFDAAGDPVGVDRLGYVLEPEAPYERNPLNGGGCEDARVTYIAVLKRFVMTYTAFGPTGPRVAVAISDDLVTWRRLGKLEFAKARVDFHGYGNKDACFFPEPVIDPNGKVALALIHRPTYRQHFPDGTERIVLPDHITDERECVWISYVALDRCHNDERWLTHVHENHLLLSPRAPWEQIKVGGGPPPIPTSLGWVLVYHGIRPVTLPDGSPAPRGQYCAGVAVLDRNKPWHVLYRSPEPVLVPTSGAEQTGVVENVVFPTGLDVRQDMGPDIVDVYYGMADTRIGAARMCIPSELPLRVHKEHDHIPTAEHAAADHAHPDAPKLVPPQASGAQLPPPVRHA